MKFDEFDRKMRVYELNVDQYILPELYIVARLDGRNFSRLTKEICDFDAPFDERFRDMMVNTVKHLMNCGFRVIYGYTESDEISLLFHRDEDAFGRKVRKYNSILAGEASGKFSVELGMPVAMDCRVLPLPSVDNVKDYFLWRQEDAHRNSLNAHCYWMLRKEGHNAVKATKMLEGKSVSEKNELLFSRGINFNDLPFWQKRGIGMYWTEIEKEGFNPLTKETTTASRREIAVEYNLPLGTEYAEMVERIMSENTRSSQRTWYEPLLAEKFLRFFGDPDSSADDTVFGEFRLLVNELTTEFVKSEILSNEKNKLAVIWNTIPHETSYQLENLTAEQIAVLLMHPFWSRMGGSYEIESFNSGELKRRIFALKEKH